jgi:purine-binding chemotaxis protein CheW
MSAEAPALATGWCTFQVAGGLYGLPVACVHEVLRAQPLTRVPLAPPAVAGLLNLRGQIVPAVDLRALFGREPGESPGGLVVVRAADGLTALIVDGIGDVRRREGAQEPRELHRDSPYDAGTLALPDRLLTVLDVDRLLEQAFEPAGRAPLAHRRAPAQRLPGE